MSTNLEEMSFWSAHLPRIAKGVGIFLIIIPLFLYFISGLTLSHLILHLLIVAPLTAVPIYGGYWIEQGNISPRRWPRISKWFFGVTVVFLALNVAMMMFWGNSALYNFMWGLFAVGIGSAGGFAIGLFEARAIEQERLAERRRTRQEAALRRAKQFEEFAKIVTHDLRNPLNVAWGRLELAQEEHDSDHLAVVKDSLERMDEIIEDVLTLTWGGQGIKSEDLELVRLGEVAQASWSHVDAPDAKLRIEDSPTVSANARRFQRLLENLFRNAVEHGEPSVTVRVGALPDGFFVEDDGPGIPPDSREQVFEAGYSSNEEGTGLGLNIVQTIAEAHGWDVSVTSGQEDGARFEFTGVEERHQNDHSRPPQRNHGSVRSDRETSPTPDSPDQ